MRPAIRRSRELHGFRQSRIRQIGRVALCGAALLVACAPPPVVEEDAPVVGGAPSVELGTGSTGFEPIDDGDTLLIARGCQGSQHVWISLRSRNMATRGTYVHLWMDGPDGEEVTLEFVVRLSFMPSDDGTYGELPSLTLQLPDPDGAEGSPLTLHAEIRDRDGLVATAERAVTVMWGTEVCMAVDAGPEADAGVAGDAGTDAS